MWNCCFQNCGCNRWRSCCGYWERYSRYCRCGYYRLSRCFRTVLWQSRCCSPFLRWSGRSPRHPSWFGYIRCLSFVRCLYWSYWFSDCSRNFPCGNFWRGFLFLPYWSDRCHALRSGCLYLRTSPCLRLRLCPSGIRCCWRNPCLHPDGADQDSSLD